MPTKSLLKSIFIAGLMLSAAGCSAPAETPTETDSAAAPEDFTSLFDGETLNGWKGDPAIWSVRDGAITGHAETDVPSNTYLILEKPHETPDYEIRFQYRWLSEAGNSGLQFRSGQIAGNHVMGGLQANIVALGGAPARFAMLYDEIDRQELVLTGQNATIERGTARGGTGRIIRTVHGLVNQAEDLQAAAKPRGEWNEAVLIVYGNRYVYAMNNLLAFDAVDEDPLAPKDGLIGFQFHFGPPTTIQFKDIEIRSITSMPDISHFASTPAPAPTPARTYRDGMIVNAPDLPLTD